MPAPSDTAVALIKDFEGFRPDSYPNVTGLAIGYGHHGPEVMQGQRISLEQAEKVLARDIAKVGAQVLDLVRVALTQNQLDALTSLVFNIGPGNFARSRLLVKLNNGDYAGTADAFLAWRRAGGKVLPDLEERRKRERDLFLS